MYYFLDVDGVLNCESDWERPFSINLECLKNFITLLEKDKDPHIILSSTWRVGYTNTGIVSSKSNNLMKMLEEFGFRIEGTTPVSNKTRQEEIEFFIRRNNVTDYIVLDDDDSLFPRPSEINLYITDFRKGLTDNDVKRIIKSKKGR